MKTRMLVVVTLITLVAGCQTTHCERKPRWEIVITANVEYKPDHFTATKAGVEFKRPLQVSAVAKDTTKK